MRNTYTKISNKGSKKFSTVPGLILLAVMSLFCGINSYGQTVVTFTSSSTWTVPAGVTTVQIQCWGGGGAGGGCQASGSNRAGGGGAGGTYTLNSNVSVTPLQVITVTVGAGGVGVSAGNGNPGGTTTFASSTPVSAVGGGGGIEGTSSVPNGAGASASVGITHNGGAGQNGTGGTGNFSGGGGGSAGTASNGNTGTQGGVAAVTGGGPGATGIGSAGNGTSPASGPGGGGGGGFRTGAAAGTGGSGYAGQVVVTYYPAPTITSFTPNNGCGNASTVTLTGTNFTTATSVKFGGTSAASYTVVSATTITAVPGTGTTGTISVTTLGGTATSSGTFTVFATPTATASSNSPICVGTTLSFTGGPAAMTTYAWTGPNSFTSSSQSPSISNAQSAATGTYILTVTNSVGCTSTASAVVVVNASPSPVISSNSPCTGASLNFTSTPGGATSYSWTGPNGFTSSVQNPSISNVTLAASGTYFLTVTVGGGCTGTTSASITVNAFPVITSCPSNVSGYSGSSLCSGAITYNSAVANVGTITYSQNSGTQFNVGVTNVVVTANNNGCTATCGFNITVIDTVRPVFTACPNDSIVCPGIVIYTTPTATDACGGIVSGTLTFTNSGTFTVPTYITSLTVYLWGGGGAGGGSSSSSNANWSQGGGGGGGACTVNNITVSANQVYTVTVGTGGSGNTATGSAGNASTFVGTAGTFTAAGGAGGAKGTTGANTTNAGGAGGSTGTGTIHSGGNGSAGYNGTGATGTGGGGGGSTGNGGSPTPAQCNVTGAGGTGTYHGGNGGYNNNCESTSDNNGTAGSAPGGGGSGCNQYLYTVVSGGNGANGQVIIVYSGVAPVPTITQTSGLPSGSVFPSGVTTNSFVAADANGNTSACTFTVSGLTPPTVFNVTGGGNYCSGGGGLAVGLNGSTSGVSYQLLFNNSNVGSPVTGTGSAFNFPNQTATGTYTVTANNGNCTVNMNGSTTITILTDVTTPTISTQPVGTTINTCTHTVGSPLSVVASHAVYYQWYLNGNPVSGATSATYSPNASGSYYVICTNPCATNQTVQSNTVTCSVTGPNYASLPYQQNFDGAWISDACGHYSNDVPDNYWNNTIGGTSPTGDDVIHRADYSGGDWSFPEPYSPLGALNTNYSAMFNNYEATSGSTGAFDLNIDLSTYAGNKQLTFYYINPDDLANANALRVQVSTNGGTSFVTGLTLGIGVTSWTLETLTIPSNSATCIIRFLFHGNFGDADMGIDQVNVVPSCTGTPTPGLTESSSNPVCSGTNFLLSLQENAVGQTYQWQISTDSLNWSNITGATSATYTTSELIAHYYRCFVTCTSTGLTAYSTPLNVTIAGFQVCYCATNSTYGCTYDGTTDQVIFNTLNTYVSCPGSPYEVSYPDSGSYTTSIIQNLTYNITAEVSNYANAGVWIDWNHDGVYDASEFTYLGTMSTNVLTPLTASITVPSTALGGLTGMRVRSEYYGYTLISTESCTTLNYGSTEDFVINVIIPQPCSGTPTPGNTISNLNPVCPSTAFALSIQNYSTGQTYQWQSSPNNSTWTNIAGATGTTYTGSQTSVTYYRCLVTCTASGLSATSSSLQETLNSFMYCYCTPSSEYGYDGSYGLIQHVVYNTLNNSTSTALSSPYYYLFPDTGSLTTSVTQLVNYNLSVTSTAYNWTGVWIDWNQDGIFETSEYYSLGYNSGGSSWTGSRSITVPITALTGQTRMRVRTEEYAEGDTGAVYSCNQMYFGESKDYIITVVAAPPCSGTPNPGNTLTTLSAVCNSNPQSFTLSLQNNINGAGGTYQWQSSSNDISWTNISGATAPTYTTTESTTTYYQCIVTCTASGLSATSTPVVVVSSFIGCYCTSTSDYGGTDGGSDPGYYGLITNETFNNLNHSKSIGVPSPYYELYPSSGTDTTSVYVGSSYTLSMTSYYYNWAGAWIDYDHSGTFDASEYYSFGFNSTGVQWTGSQTITIPLTATGGPTRIRFRTEYYGETDTGATNACTLMYYGETEDFNINIVYPVPTITGYSISNGCVGNTITINGTNFVGVDSVKFSNNVNVSFVVNSPTSISVVVPTGAVTGAITVITGGGIATGPSFGVNGTAPVITTQPSTAQFCTPGTSLIPFTVSATGTGINYQWYKDSIAMSDGGNISGSHTSTLDISNPSYSDTATYYVSVYSSSCVTNSNTVILFALGTNPSITSFSALPNTICAGSISNLNAISTGAYINWWSELTGGTLLTTTPSDTNYAVSPTSTTTYYAEAQDFSQVTQTISSSGSFTVPVGVTSITAYLWGGGGAGAGGAATNTDYDNGGGGGGGACTINTISVVPGQVYTITVGTGGTGSTGAGGAGGTTTIIGPAGTFSAGGGAGGAIAGTGTGVGGSGGNGGSSGTGTVISGGSGSAGNNGSGITGTGGGGAGSGGGGTTPASACGVVGTGGTGIFPGGNGGYNTNCGNNDLYTNGVSGSIPSGGGSGNQGWIGGYAGGNGASGQVVLSWLSSGCASTFRTPITVTVNQLPIITNQPISTQTICSGNSVSTSVTATGSSLTYQWYYGSTLLTNGGAISGVNTSTLTINPVNISNASNNYNVVITGTGGCSLTSNNSAIIVNSPPSINSQPVSQFACSTGSSASFIVGANGTSLSYQWYLGSNPISNGGNISGATSPTLTINPVNSGNFASNYYVIITGICGTPVTSNNVSLSLTTTPVILTQPPVSSTGCTGSSINISVVGSAVGSYQWYKGNTQLNNGGNISGATSSTLTISSLNSGNAASNYNVVLTGCSTSVTSNNSALVVATLPTPIASSNSPICTLNSLSLSTTPNGMSNYSWSGPNSYTSIIQNPTAANPVAGIYNVTVTDGNNCTGVSSATVVLTSGITIISASSTSPVCSGTSSLLTSNASTTPYVLSSLTTDYSLTISTGNYSSTAGTVTTLVTGVGTANQNYTVPIPFPFNYLGVNYTSLFLNTNGFISFGSAPTPSSSTPISSTDTYAGAIAAQGMVGLIGRGTGARLNYSIAGSAPNRTFSLIWYRYTTSGDGDYYDFEIVLNETTNVIDIIYDYETIPTETTSCQVGLRGVSNSDFNNRATGSNWSTTTSGSSDTATCALSPTISPGGGLEFIYTPTSHITYNWSPSTGLLPNSTNQNVTTPSLFYPSTNSYTVIATASNGCTASAQTSIVVNQSPTVSVTPHLSSYCVSNITNIPLTATGADTYSWSPTNNLTATTGPNVTANPSVSTSYFVTGFSNSLGCSSKDTAVINVGSPVILSITALSGQGVTPPTETGSICSGSTDNLRATAYTGVNYTASSAPYTSYSGIANAISGYTYGSSIQSHQLEFTFNFYGTNYTSCYIGENGYITFGSGYTSTAPQTLPNNSTPNNIIALAWSKLDVTNNNSGDIDSFTVGVAPYRKYVVRYNNIKFNTGTSDTGRLTGAIVLCETTNNIELYISTFNPSLVTTYATCGIENATGSVATIVSGWNNNHWTTSNFGEILSPTGGTFSYSWTPTTGLTPSPSSASVTTPLLTSNAIYTVTAVEQYGCTAVQTVGETVNALPTFTTTHTNDSCNGQSNGTITVTASGGPGLGYKYSDNNGSTYQNSNVFTGLSPGTYSVVVKDSINDYFCPSAMSTVTISQPAALSFTTTFTNVLCFGGSTGSITVTGSGGTTPYSYSKTGLNSLQSSNFFGSLADGNYPIAIEDANLCSTTPAIVAIGQPNPITVSSTTRTNVSVCFGNSNGGITVIGASGGTSPYSYSDNSGSVYQSSNIFGGLTAGTYTVRVRDANLCVFSVTPNVTLTQPQQLLISSAAVSNVFPCHGSNNGTITVSVTGGTGSKSYSKDGINYAPGGNTSTIFSSLIAGTYSLKVKDANGCISPEVTRIVTQPDSVTFTYTETDVVCYNNGNGTITMTGAGGNGTYIYSIDSGNTFTNPMSGSYTFTSLVPGTYKMVAQDGDYNQCTSGEVSVTVNQPSLLTFTTLVTNVTGCIGGSNATIEMDATGGFGTLVYSIDGGQHFFANHVFSNLFAGTYSLVVKDANNCTAASTVIVGQPTQTYFTVDTLVNVSPCYGGVNGYFDLDGHGGTGFYHYSDNGGNTFTPYSLFAPLTAGAYNCQIVDNNGCLSGISTVTVTQPAEIVFSTSVHNASCNVFSNGTITVTATGGTGALRYSDNGGATYQSGNEFIGLSSGVYSIVVKDSSSCTAHSSVSITQPNTLIAVATGTNLTCNGNHTGTVSVSVSGGTQPYYYNWNNAYNTPSVTGLAAGTYNITVTDANGCVSQAAVTLTEPSVLTASVSETDLTCYDNSTGTVSLTVSGGIQPYNYNWNSNSTTENMTGISAGTYSVTVSDANGCIITSSITVGQPDSLIAEATPYGLYCNGDNSGEVTLDVTGGTQSYSFDWNNGAYNTQDMFNIPAGTYTVAVTDANGCSAVTSTVVTEPAAIVATSTETDLLCNGDGSGTAGVTASGGSSPYYFNWDTGDTTPDITGLSAGTYEVTIYDNNGCMVITDVTVNEPDPIFATAGGVNLNCNGDGSGSVSVSATGGTLPYNYIWSNGSTSPGQTGLQAGTYAVTVSDANGCTPWITSVTITEPSALLTTASGTNLSCNSSANGTVSVTATGGTQPYAYSWNNLVTTSGQTGLTVGTYIVTVTDYNNCSATNSVIITQPAVLVTAMNGTNLTCNGNSSGMASVTASGGTGPYGYLWNGGATASGQSNLAVGTYTVTVTDQNGCSSANTVSITEPVVLMATASGTNLTCNGSANGTVSTVVNGGTAPYGYLWNNGATTADQNGLSADPYTVTVSDNNGCPASVSSVTITEPVILSTTAGGTNLTCNGNGTGAVSVNATGGTMPYGYLWSNGATIADPTGLQAGTYGIIVTDHNGCTATNSVTISEPAVLATTTSGTNLTCNGSGNGTVSVAATGGTSPYTYIWNNTASVSSQSNLAAGTYAVTVTDQNGCSSINTVTVSQPAILTATSTGTDLSCNGSANGTVSVSVSGGTLSYSYSWSNGVTTASQSGLTANIYTVNVTDNNGCTTSSSLVVNQPAVLVATASESDLSCNGNGSGTASVSVTGGTMAYSYSWTGPNSYTSAVQNPAGLGAGTYNVTVTDAHGCISNSSTVINQPAVLTSGVTGTNLTCNGNGSGSVSLTITGGTGGYGYSWTGPNNYTSSLQNPGSLAAGTYTVIVTDAHNCATSSSVTLTQPGVLSPVASGTNLSCNGSGNGTVSVSVSGGTNPYTYSWNNGVTTASQGSLAAATYTVMVTDNNLCTATSSVTVNQPAVLVATASGTNLTCNGNGSGSVSVSVTGGNGGNTFSWTGPNNYTSAVQNPGGLAAGTYNVTVTDGHGCASASSVTITQTGTLTPTITATNLTCNGNGSGAVSVSVTGGLTPYSYSWNNGPTNSSQSGLAAGPYTVAITDANHCTASSSVTLTQPATVVINSVTSTTNILCNGGTTGAINGIVASGGTGTLMYSDGGSYQLSNSFATLTAGTYSLIVRDGNLCTSVVTNVILTQHTAITFTSSVTNVNGCYNTNNGSISPIVASGGSGSGYNYSDNGGSSYQLQTGFHSLAEGTYAVMVKDNNQCTSAPVPTTVGGPAQVVITNVAVTNETCNGQSLGSVAITATGGTGTLHYSDNGGSTYPQTQGAFGSLAAGTYSMEVKDANGCLSGITLATVTQPAAVTFTTSNTPASNCVLNTADGTITVTASGGNAGGYYYSDNGGSSWSSLNHNVFGGLTAGTYSIKVEDIHACASTVTGDVLTCNEPRLALSGEGTNFAFTVYPNPANDHAMVEFTTDAASAYKIVMTDVLGRTLMNLDGIAVIGDNQRQLDVSTLAKGVYMISIETRSNKKTIKLVLQ